MKANSGSASVCSFERRNANLIGTASPVICSTVISTPSKKTLPVCEKDGPKGKGRKSSEEEDFKLSGVWHRRLEKSSLSGTLVLVKGKISFS